MLVTGRGPRLLRALIRPQRHKCCRMRKAALPVAWSTGDHGTEGYQPVQMRLIRRAPWRVVHFGTMSLSEIMFGHQNPATLGAAMDGVMNDRTTRGSKK